LLVICFRRPKTLHVNQIWRIYTKEIPIVPHDKLTSILERFADAYGRPFRIGQWRGKYLFNARVPVTEVGDDFNVTPEITGSSAGTGTAHRYGDYWHVSFGISIDVDKYKRDVWRHIRQERRAT
jgi:hypothetical protein